jgi:hypothetical protein
MTGQAFDPGSPVAYAWAGEFLERYVRARTVLDISSLMELFTPDGELAPDPFGVPFAGTNAIRAYFLQCAGEEADVEFTIERPWVSGSTILAAWHASFVRQRDRAHVREAGFLTAEIRQEHCSRLRIWTVEHIG